MITKVDWDLIVKYLEGNCSETEQKLISEWAESSMENRQELDLAAKIWKSPAVPMPKPDVEQALARVKQRIESAAIPNAKKTNPLEWVFDFLSGNIINSAVLKTAAAVIIFFVFYIMFDKSSDVPLKEIMVQNTEIQTITLPDKSTVIIDAGSDFKYPEAFNMDTREVYLNGEAYFEIQKDDHKPFIIHANEGRVRVVGTKFNVRAWHNSKKVSVSVVEGIVSFGPENGETTQKDLLITKGSSGYLNENGAITKIDSSDVALQLGWLHREMSFNNVKLIEVLHQVERWYDLKIILPDQSYSENRVTIFIQNKPVEEILEVISLVINLKFEMSGKEVRFY